MSLRITLRCLIPAVALAGCAQQPPAPSVPPNPFGYLKPSAVCKPGPVAKTAAGLEVAMKVRSDDGYCGVDLHAPAGGAYMSFVLTALPAHGKSFIYNYNNHTAVTYTAATAYAGADSFTVSLIPAASEGSTPGSNQKRVPLKVLVTVDATGVAPPAPPPPPAKPEPHHARHHRASKTK